MAQTTQTKEVYSDIDNSMSKDSSGNLKLVKDKDAVAQALDNIILTPIGSRKFKPVLGSSIPHLVFELVSDSTALMIEGEIRRAVAKYEPRVTLTRVSVEPDYDENSYAITVEGRVAGLHDFAYSRVMSAD